MLEKFEWGPDRAGEVHPAFWYAIAHVGEGKVTVGTFEELQEHIAKYLADHTEEKELARARKALEYERNWYTH